jgi:D-glycero-alpha-D-manno-heptose-7-phosphate kinase
MTITATVPTRIDLAGGTLDVYPLYIFEGGGLTVNAAIDVRAGMRVTPRDDARLILRSRDLGAVEEIASLAEMTFGGPLDLIKRALHYYRPPTGLEIIIHSEAPAGSGLGASSALLMALSTVLNEISGRGLDRREIIDVGANIEAQVIGVPTGKQDYFPPLYGGIGAIWFEIDGWRHEALAAGVGDGQIAALNERLIVSFTGIPHYSAITNWAMLKRYIEKEGDAVARMSEIKAIATAMRGALAVGDMGELARLLDAEWQLRKGLAEGVTTPAIDAMVAAAAAAGALASKICGAGGGGCMITLAPPERREAVAEVLAGAGARVMAASGVAEGIEIQR